MRKCEYCGTPRHKGEMKCPACGAYYPDAETGSDGVPASPAVIEDSVTGGENKSDFRATVEQKLRTPAAKKITDALLFFAITLFLGVLGIHRFAKGKVLSGLLWLFTCGLFGVGYVVDLVLSVCTLAKAGVGYARHVNDNRGISETEN